MNKTYQEHTYNDIMLGARASFGFSITEKVVTDFTLFSGDTSPVHTDKAYAALTAFRRPIAHGMIAGALFSRLVGMELPGKYAIYLSQSLSFHRPIFPGTEVEVVGIVTHKSDASRTITLGLKILDRESGISYVEGEALVRLLK